MYICILNTFELIDFKASSFIQFCLFINAIFFMSKYNSKYNSKYMKNLSFIFSNFVWNTCFFVFKKMPENFIREISGKFMLLGFIFLFVNAKAQTVEVSPDENYFATFFIQKKDSVVFVKENNEYKEVKTIFAKYKVSIFDAHLGNELHFYETKLFQLQILNPTIKMHFTEDSEFLYVAIENSDIVVFNMHKGFVTKYVAQDFTVTSDKTDLAILKPDAIIFLNSEKKVTRDFSGFTFIDLIAKNKFAIVSRFTKNKYTAVVIELENPKNDKIIKYETWAYNDENEEIICLNSSKLIIYKLSSFKEKEIDLDKEYTSADYKKKYSLAHFNSNGSALMLLSSKNISILTGKGKKIANIDLPENFISAKWIDNENLQIVSLSEISTFNLTQKKITETFIIDFKISDEAKFMLGNDFERVLHISNTAKIGALNMNNEITLKNINTKEEKKLIGEFFLNFSNNENYFFTKTNNFETKVYKLDNFFKKNDVIILKTELFNLLSPIGGSFYATQNIQNYYNSDFSQIGIPFSMFEIDSITGANNKNFQVIYNEAKKNKNFNNLPIQLYTKKVDAISLFDLSTKTSKNITINFTQKLITTNQSDSNFWVNPLIRQNFIDQYKNKENELLENKRNTEKLFWKNGENLAIHNLKLTNQNTIIYHAKENSRYKVTDIEVNEELDYLAMGDIFFSPNNAYAIVSAALKTILYNTVKGREMRSYSDIYTNILLTNDTTFFVGMNKSNNYVFVSLTKKIDIQTSIAKISKNGKFLITISKDRTQLKRFSLPEMKEISSVKISDLYKRYFYSPIVNVSENANFISVQYKNELSFFSTQIDNDVNNVKTIENVCAENPIYWLNNNEALIFREESSIVLNVQDGNYKQNQDFNFYLPQGNAEMSNSSNYIGFISNNAQFAVAQYSDSEQDFILLKNTSQKYNFFKIKNAKFITFDNESKRVFFLIGKSRLAILETNSLLDSTNKELSYETIRAANRQNRQLPPRPKPITFDSPTPEGYHYERFVQEKDFSLIENSKAGIYAHNLISEGNNVKLNLHVLDKKGNFYSGINSIKDKDVWCELFIKYPDGTTQKIENFEVSENDGNNIENPVNYALGLVLDHSGSMGNERCNYLQKGVKSFIQQKKDFLSISVLKFDENVKTEINLNSSKANLLKKIEIIGDKGFGGNTALYDATYEGIFEVNKADKNFTKAIIVITDGYENASYTYLNELILFALEHNVKVYTVGFGAYINKPILQTIAYQTGGSFYHIYKTQDFEWISQDIYNKLSHYYSIRFATPQKGKYTLMLKPCSEKIDNQIFIAFDNNDIDYKKLTEYQHDGFGIPFLDMSDSLQVSVFEGKEPISSIDRIVSKNGSNLDFYAPREFDKIKFPDIKFVTDKTEIIKDTDKGLQEVIVFLEKYPKIIIEISGHTDEVGTNEKNLDLSHRRADKIKEIMVSAGIEANRILTAGFGETKPIASNSTPEGKLKNRRVEFRIIK